MALFLFILFKNPQMSTDRVQQPAESHAKAKNDTSKSLASKFMSQ